MPAAVISISDRRTAAREGTWSLLELALPGCGLLPVGILLADNQNDRLSLRLLDTARIENLEEEELEILDALGEDLRRKSAESGAFHLLQSLEDSLSHFLRISGRTAVSFTGDPQKVVDRLFDEYVDATVRPFVTHLPFYTLRAAATRFGESMDSEQEGWLRVAGSRRLTEDMFVARVVGRSMEPLIGDGDLCVFRANVMGSRQNKRLLIEQFSETDFASRYTVKRYTSVKKFSAADEWEHEQIRLEPLNREFPAFNLTADRFRVIAEFVEVLPA